ncbi:restriction endonuclease subunit S [Bacteroides caccae]|uniref:restriction endonuclease subunit S n=1 Tax=Bacteroides caccae TaxID=47678 RepID=UPI0012314107|nr:restriction endonuclease subunit S [Bacteroides caccae]KAA5444821.1 restriction endonuclease subunit S [Bacteroides caccae]
MSSYYEKILATGEVKCIDEQVPFEIPQGWEWCRLGEISTYAQTKRKINASNADSQLWGLDLEDIEKGGRLLNIKTVGERKAIGDKTIFNRGDILYSKLRPYLLKILVAPEGGICTPEIIPFTCYGNICKDYIVSFLKSPYVDDYINSVTFGVKMPRVSTETMTSLLVPLPPLSEQFRIDTKTKDLMPYIDGYGKAQNKLNKLNEELSNTIRKSILQEAIQGKLVPQIGEEGTAKELLKQIKEEKLKLVKEGKLKKSALNDSVIFRGDDNKYWEKSTECMECIDDKIPFEIPSTWCWVRHNQLFEISGGSQPPKSQFVDNPKSGYIRLYQIRDYGSNPMPVYIPKEKANKITKEGDIILARYGGSLGKVFWAKDGAYNVAMAKVIPLFDSEFVNKQYLFLFYQSSIYQYLVKDHSRSAQAGFNKDDLTDLFFPLPPLEEQSRIVEKYKSVTSIMS